MPTHRVQEDPVVQQCEEGGVEDVTPEGEERVDAAGGERLEEEGDFGGQKEGVGQEEDQDSDAGWETDLEIEGAFVMAIM